MPLNALVFAILFIASYAYSTRANAQIDQLNTPLAAFHAQTTYIWQSKPGFGALYSGPNSLRTQREEAYSLTVTADLGLRLWPGAQLHINPEGAQGNPFSNLTGSGGISNGELQRGSSSSLATYPARFFVQQRIQAGGALETVDPEFNELGGRFAAHRWTITLGTFSLLDYFDNSPYAKDPREQFMNWAFMTYGAWDYAADARGYTTGFVVEYRTPNWSVRAGRAMQPRDSNGLVLEPSLGVQYGDQIELDGNLPMALPAGPLRARALLFSNRVNGGSFTEALALGGMPDVALVRRSQVKTGWGLTLEAPLSADAGLFLRASRNSGNVESYAFTEIDSQVAVGGQFTASALGRGQDRWGVAYAVNGLSESHRDYLAAGGLGFFLGDGQLNYDSERILEAYYRFVLPDWTTAAGKVQSALSLGYQYITNPGYNRDRGPAQVFTFRWHTEF